MIPLHRRPAFQGLFGMVFGMAGAMGPLIGGALTEVATWRWCFYINLPAGVVALVVMILVWNPPKQQRRHYGRVTFLGHIKRLDPVGMFFFVPATVSLLLCLQWGGSVYRWDEWRIVMLFGVAGMATIGFISVQIIKPNTAMVPPRIITQRSVALGVSFTFFLSASMLLLMYFIPIWCTCYHIPPTHLPMHIKDSPNQPSPCFFFFFGRFANESYQSKRLSGHRPYNPVPTPYLWCSVSLCPASYLVSLRRRPATTSRPCSSLLLSCRWARLS